MNNNLYRRKRFLLMTMDPVHIGTGGNRLGRVDLSIVREPGTRLPKIPGTSLSGAIRQYSAYRYESPNCAGQGQDSKDEDKHHCRFPTCPICYTFGYLKGQDGGQSGAVSIGDARLLLFPVHSLAGPVWVTSPGALREFGLQASVDDNAVRLAPGLTGHQHLNLGWLMLPKEEGDFFLPDGIPDEIKSRAVLASDKLFSQVVNSNLEVRTSVSIDPNTGAASEGALFTYEAIPRATLLWLDVIEDNLGDFFPTVERLQKWSEGTLSDKERQVLIKKAGWQDAYVTIALTQHQPNAVGNSPLEVVKSGLKLAEYLGIGGMSTRGFGRVQLLNGEVTS